MGGLIQMVKRMHDAFWRGYGSIIVLRPRRRGQTRFTYKGRDIGEITAKEAIESDWSLVAHHLTAAFKESQQDERTVVESSR